MTYHLKLYRKLFLFFANDRTLIVFISIKHLHSPDVVQSIVQCQKSTKLVRKLLKYHVIVQMQ